MGEAYSTHGRGKKCTENLNVTDHLEDLGVDM